MSPWSQDRGPVWPLYVGTAVVVIGLLGGYLMMTGPVGAGEDGDGDAATPGVVSTPADEPGVGDEPTEPTAAADAALRLVSWGVESGQLAVVVRNDAEETVEEMRVRITARDEEGDVVLSTTGSESDVCCTIVGLPPGEYFGLFTDVDPVETRTVTEVEVEPVAPGSDASGPRASVEVGDPRMERYADDTVVTATVTTRGRGLSGYLAVQAFLVGPRGRVVQVVSGRFYCFGPGASRQVRLHLFHAVPATVRLDRVVAYPIPVGVPPRVPGECA